MSFRSFVLLCIVCITMSCSHKESGSQVFDAISGACGQQESCKVDLKTAMKFDWDKVYVFDQGATAEDVNNALGFTYPYYKEFSERIVFTKGDTVAYHEEAAVKFDGVDPKGGGLPVYFPIKANEKYFTAGNDAAVFEAKKDKSETGETVYYLTQQVAGN